jgi:cysteinyl-tRNA synthetase
MANVWMHNGFLQVEGEKMAKSEGNFVTIRDLLKDWPGEVLRFNMLRTHYRQPIDWTMRGLDESWKVLDDWYAISGDPTEGIAGSVLEALTDDLNTPNAITALHGLRTLAEGGDRLALNELTGSLQLLGFLRDTTEAWKERRHVGHGIEAPKVDALIDARNTARKAKNWKEADRIRAELSAMGIELEDTKDGTTWKVKR